MEIREHYFEVLDVIDALFRHIFEGLTHSYGELCVDMWPCCHLMFTVVHCDPPILQKDSLQWHVRFIYSWSFPVDACSDALHSSGWSRENH